MDGLSSLLFPDQYGGDLKEQKKAGYGSPARGTGQSMFLTQAREEDRQAGLTGLGSTLGSMIQLIAFLNASKAKKKPTTAPNYGSNYDYGDQPAPVDNNFQRMHQEQMMMRYLQMMQTKGSGTGVG